MSEASKTAFPPSSAVRERIDADIKEETRAANRRAIFAVRAEAKRPKPPKRKPMAHRSYMEVYRGAPDEAGAASDGFDYLHAAEGDYRAVCENLTGRFMPDPAFEKLRARRERQDRDTVEIAKALECRGERFYYGENWAGKCTIVGLFSGCALDLPPVRRVSFMPSIAAPNRAKMLRDVETFILANPTRSRMFTITNGPRVPIHSVTLREDIKGFHRWLSKMAANRGLKMWGLKIQWRATEFGEPKWDPETGQMTLHLHAHVLVTEPEGITPKRRGKIRTRLWKLFGVHWDDGGVIENAREFVKYPVKDADIQTILREGGPGLLCDFFTAVKGLHIVQPMGDLKAERSRRRATARRITSFHRSDGRTLEETGDWNAVRRPFPQRSKAREEYLRRVKENEKWRHATLPPFHLGAETARADALAEIDEGNAHGRASVGERATPRVANRIISRLAPAPYGSPVFEPAVVVWGFDGNLAAVLQQPKVARLVEMHRAAYEQGCANRRVAARSADTKGSQRSNNCPRGLADVADDEALKFMSDPPERVRPTEKLALAGLN